MKETIEKAISLGLGIVIAGKEQIEKTMDELVKKGEVNRAESKALADELMKKGEETRQRIEELVRERIDAIMGELRPVSREDFARIEQRLDALERRAQAGN